MVQKVAKTNTGRLYRVAQYLGNGFVILIFRHWGMIFIDMFQKFDKNSGSHRRDETARSYRECIWCAIVLNFPNIFLITPVLILEYCRSLFFKKYGRSRQSYNLPPDPTPPRQEPQRHCILEMIV